MGNFGEYVHIREDAAVSSVQNPGRPKRTPMGSIAVDVQSAPPAPAQKRTIHVPSQVIRDAAKHADAVMRCRPTPDPIAAVWGALKRAHRPELMTDWDCQATRYVRQSMGVDDAEAANTVLAMANDSPEDGTPVDTGNAVFVAEPEFAPTASTTNETQAKIAHACRDLALTAQKSDSAINDIFFGVRRLFSNPAMAAAVALDEEISSLDGTSADYSQTVGIAVACVLLRVASTQKWRPGEYVRADVDRAINRICGETRDLLLEKNRAYGNSALDPVRIFSKADPGEQLLVRIDDKLSRLARGRNAGEDVEQDFLGYLVLLLVCRGVGQ